MPQGLNIFQRTNRDFDYRRVSMIVNYDVKNKEKNCSKLNNFSSGKRFFTKAKEYFSNSNFLIVILNNSKNFLLKRSVMLRCN